MLGVDSLGSIYFVSVLFEDVVYVKEREEPRILLTNDFINLNIMKTRRY